MTDVGRDDDHFTRHLETLNPKLPAGAWVPDDKTAAILGPVAFALMSLFGGFFLNIDSLPSYISWLQYLSLFKYAFAAIMQNEFRGLKFTCDDQDSR
jgi:ABC-type multidrug transport system permease subunit